MLELSDVGPATLLVELVPVTAIDVVGRDPESTPAPPGTVVVAVATILETVCVTEVVTNTVAPGEMRGPIWEKYLFALM